MKVTEIQQPVKEISLVRIDKKPFYKASELDTSWDNVKRESTVYQSKLYPDLMLGIHNPSYLSVYLFKRDNPRKPVAYLEFSPSKGRKQSVGWEVNIASVRSTQAGKGYGFAIYKILIRELDYVLVSDTTQSIGGAKIWYKLYQTPGITVYGWDPQAPQDEQFFQVTDENGDGMLDGADRRVYDNPDDPVYDSPRSPGERSDMKKSHLRKLVAVKTRR
jgi:hypothetical protein